jgi:cytoskeletal protein CcmA (bactofilin family)
MAGKMNHAKKGIVMKFRRKPSSEEISGFLDQGTSLTGELQFSGTLRLDGNFHGSIHSGDILVIGEHADIHADIKVSEIEIHGRVFGNLEAKRRIEIYPTGRVRGDVQTPILVVNAGAAIDGKTRMASENEENGNPAEGQRLMEKGANEAH